MPTTVRQGDDKETPTVTVWPHELGEQPDDRQKEGEVAAMRDRGDKGEKPLMIPAVEALAMAKAGRIPLERLEQFMPTVRVHVYHDTGERVTIKGKEYPVVRAQASYGYYVEHEGDLYGWDQALQGAQKIAPNFYLLAVPDSGVATVKNTIMAIDTEGCHFLKRFFG